MIVLGKASFNLCFDVGFISEESAKKRINSEKWCLYERTYLRQNWGDIFSQMEDSEVELLNLNSNRQGVVREIFHINFWKLQTLNLRFCNIMNIEFLSYLNVPNIKEVNLEFNQIVSLESLDKLDTEKVQSLLLNRNPLKQPKLHHTNLKGLSRITLQDRNSKPIVQDLTFLCKTNIGSKLNSLNVDHKTRVNWDQGVKALRRRHHKTKVKWVGN